MFLPSFGHRRYNIFLCIQLLKMDRKVIIFLPCFKRSRRHSQKARHVCTQFFGAKNPWATDVLSSLTRRESKIYTSKPAKRHHIGLFHEYDVFEKDSRAFSTDFAATAKVCVQETYLFLSHLT